MIGTRMMAIQFALMFFDVDKFYWFCRGKIKYFTCPPETFSPTTHLSSTIVMEMAKEFSLDDVDFKTQETAEIEQLPFIKPSGTVSIETMGFFEGESNAMECDDAVSVSSKKESAVKIEKPKLAKRDKLKTSEVMAKKKANPEDLLPGNQRSNRMKRLQMKKAKKEHARKGIDI